MIVEITRTLLTTMTIIEINSILSRDAGFHLMIFTTRHLALVWSHRYVGESVMHNEQTADTVIGRTRNASEVGNTETRLKQSQINSHELIGPSRMPLTIFSCEK